MPTALVTLSSLLSHPAIWRGDACAPEPSALPSGKEMVVTLTGVPDNQRVTVSLTDVNGAGVNADASMGFLVGDVNSSRTVNAGDILGVKARQGQPIDSTNFRFDL